jgi:DNA-binding NtrC family response regulator
MADTIDVLHVDDDGALLDIVATFLECADDRIRVTSERDPTAAPTRVRDGAFDCVLSDYQMPEMDGLELLEELQTVRPTLPVVLFTGVDDPDVAVEAIERGAVDCYRKRPGTEHYQVLAARLTSAVERRHGR